MLCGAYFKVHENRLDAVSCDSYTLSKCSVACEIHDVGNVSVIGSAFNIPGHALNEIMRFLPDKKQDVSVQIARKHAIFIIGDMVFFTRLIDGEYIDYERIMPKQQSIFITLERDRLLGALERSNLVAEEKIQGSVRSYVKLILDGDNITVTSSSVNGRVKDDIACTHEGENLEIAFNCKYLLNSVRAADSEELLITMKAPTQSITIEPKEKNEDDDFFYMILPVRMHE
jgi:DNA polymerase-3 subunit beta